MNEEAERIRERDVDDLFDAWHNAIENLKLATCEENMKRTERSFYAVLDYLHNGEVPETDDPNGRLVTVTSIVCPKCHTTYTREALERLSGKCLVCGRKEAL